MMSLFGVLFRAVRAHGQHREYEGESAEHKCLDGANEKLQPVEDDQDRRGDREQKRHHEDQDLSRHHVAEETEGEADQPRELRDQLENADESVYAVEVEELPHVSEEADRSYAPVLNEKRRYQRERKRRHQVRVDAAQVRREDAYLFIVF